MRSYAKGLSVIGTSNFPRANIEKQPKPRNCLIMSYRDIEVLERGDVHIKVEIKVSGS